jgi:hypothetical protein
MYILPHLQGSNALKESVPTTSLHGIITPKTNTDIFTSVRTSDVSGRLKNIQDRSVFFLKGNILKVNASISFLMLPDSGHAACHELFNVLTSAVHRNTLLLILSSTVATYSVFYPHYSFASYFRVPQLKS